MQTDLDAPRDDALLESFLNHLRLERRYDIDEVEGGEVIKPQNMGMEELRALDHVAHQAAHLRGVNPHGVFKAE